MHQHSGFSLSALMVDGGPTKMIGIDAVPVRSAGLLVMRSDIPELSAIGAGLLARKALLGTETAQLRHFCPTTYHFSQTQSVTVDCKNAGTSGKSAVERTRWQTPLANQQS